MNDALKSQRRLVENLRNETCYPHPAREITVIETHISFVLLAGSFAYKIKKAINLDFVHYGSLAQRRFFCEEELRLNGRLAPDVYREVVPITGSVEAPRVGGAGEPIEYAVKMRKFPQTQLLDHMLEAGTLIPRHLDQLATTLAEFHATAKHADDELVASRDFGTRAGIRAPMVDNFGTIRGLLSGTGEDLPAPLDAWSLREWERLGPLFDRRRQQGWVRECHGDMHLGNMVLLDNRVEVFDGIEFNASLRWIDVMDEIAFLVMDLEERGHEDYAWRFLNAYLEITGDYGAVAVLDFYRVHRALVRAKVALTRAAQANTDAPTREAALAAYRAYVRYAQRVIAPRQPVLLITHGVAGAGKTHVSQAVLAALGAVRLRSDVERKRLHGLSPLARSGSGLSEGLYDEASTRATYQHLQSLARMVLEAGYPVVVDAAFLHRWQRDLFAALAAELEVPYFIIGCSAPPAALMARVLRRTDTDASEASLRVLAAQQASTEPLTVEELARTLPIDTAAQHAYSFATSLVRRLARKS